MVGETVNDATGEGATIIFFDKEYSQPDVVITFMFTGEAPAREKEYVGPGAFDVAPFPKSQSHDFGKSVPEV